MTRGGRGVGGVASCYARERPASGPGVWRRDHTDTGDVTRRILAAYEAGDLITRCAWCGRVDVGGEWLPAPRAALTAIDSRLTLSHSICPSCVAEDATSAASRERVMR